MPALESQMNTEMEARAAGVGPALSVSGTRAPQDAAAEDLRVLLVDDDARLLRSYARLLRAAGIACEIATSGAEAERLATQGDYDVVVTDVLMPAMDGVELLRKIRSRDEGVPVILMTGGPSVETAAKAVEYGAVRYLFKPVDGRELVGAIAEAGRKYQRAQGGSAGSGQGAPDAEAPGLSEAFSRALSSLWMAYQPIVSWRERRVVAYEALCRSREPSFPHPGVLLDAAERLERIHELGRRIRERSFQSLPALPDDALLFINLHPMDLTDEELAAGSPDASRIVLEITERTALDGVGDLEARIEGLKEAGFRVAVDDLGAGYAGLATFVKLTPSVVKLDMSLVRNIDKEPRKAHIVRGMVDLCGRLGARVVVEGVETESERDTLYACGCDWMQGFLFGRPSPEPVALEL